jgi:serine/threonine protein kinase
MTVHTLHALNVSHEDLKRSNVLVDPVGCPSLIDFGFSHFAAYGQKVRSAGGTLDYSSPQKVEVSHWCNIC